jgi:hypothetical protein
MSYALSAETNERDGGDAMVKSFELEFKTRGVRAPGHAQRALEASALQDVWDRTWTVCRFVDGQEHGFPLRALSRPVVPSHFGTLGWNAADPVALFTEEEAREVASREKQSRISFDAPVLLSAIHWRVRLYSHFDGSEVVHETDDYREALLAFAAASDAAKLGNTETVKYLVPELDGQAPKPLRLPEGIQCRGCLLKRETIDESGHCITCRTMRGLLREHAK